MAYRSIANQIRPDQVKELRNLFKKLDGDGTGSLSTKEIKKSLFDIDNGEALFDRLREKHYGDDKITFDEFLACTIDFNIYQSEDFLQQAFDNFDNDKNGHIDHHQMAELLKNEGSKLHIDCNDIDHALKEFDSENSGNFDFVDFKALMRRLMKRNYSN